ncbi:vitamin K epoxide reductase family protein [Gemmata sp.]|uniref:vitamin K epoxide reductase family protein n=1 Tax=Gemmata sp. TaxID=1914242 RepID=UPI003F6F5EBB
MPERDPNAPPGWEYNPASWRERLPIIALAVIGFAIAMYLSLYQWHAFDRVFEPFFGDDSHVILRESGVSKWSERTFGVPDAFLGALGYLADAVAGVIGGTRRWKTMPWVVVLFGVFIGPLGAVSVLLVILQPFVGGWCTLCLLTAVISIVMIGPAMDEVLASLQHIQRERRAGRSAWRVFWGLGDPGPTPQSQPVGG